jgi:hypothetical protein
MVLISRHIVRHRGMMVPAMRPRKKKINNAVMPIGINWRISNRRTAMEEQEIKNNFRFLTLSDRDGRETFPIARPSERIEAE